MRRLTALEDIHVPAPRPDEEYRLDLLDHETSFLGLKALLGAADVPKAGERLAGLEARGEVEREAARTILSGTHSGEFMGIPATESTVEFESIDIIRLSDGKVAEHWGVTDALTLMQQIGAVPS